MSDVLIDVGKLREAESILGEALRGYRRARPPDPSRILLTAASQGRVLMLLDRPAEAEPLFRECLAAWRKSLPPRDPRIAFVESMLGGCLTKLGRLDEAEPLVLSGARTLASARAAPFVAREAFARVVALHEARGRPREAAAWRARGLDYGFPANPFAR